MTLRPYKFVVVAIVQQANEDGSVTGELRSEPVEVFGLNGLTEWAAGFPAELTEAEAKLAG